MPDTGWLSAGTISNVNSRGNTWTDTANAGASDDSYALCELAKNEDTDYLEFTNFSISIPSGSTIDGVEVRFERSDAFGVGTVVDAVVQLIKGGTKSGDNKSAGADWPGTDEVVAFGGSSDLWSLTLTESDVEASTFGFAIAADNTSGLFNITARVDHGEIRVHYTEGGNNVSLTGTATGVATINRALDLGRVLAATVSAVPAIARKLSLFRTLSATATGVANIVVQRVAITISMAATLVGVASLTSVSIFSRLLSATAVGAASLSRFLFLSRVLAATVTGVAAIARKLLLKRILAATAIGVANIAVNLLTGVTKITMSAAAIGVTAIDPVAKFFRDLNASVTGVAALTTVVKFLRALAASAVVTASIARAFIYARNLTAVGVGVANMSRSLSLSRVLEATATGVALIATTISRFRALAATVVGVASITFTKNLTLLTMAAIATGSAAISVLYRQFVTPFTGHGGLGILGTNEKKWKPRRRTWRRRR